MSEATLPPTEPPAERAARLLHDACALADDWRLRGRWDDALVLLRGALPIAGDIGPAKVAQVCYALARVLTEEATFGGYDTRTERDTLLDEAESCAEQAGDVGLLGDVLDARGMSLHATFLESTERREPAHELELFERGLALRRESGEPRAIAESLFHVGLVYGVVRQDHSQALPYFEQAYRLATEAGDIITASYAIRHIGFARHHAGDNAAAHAALLESLELRERAEFIPGVAMALVALAYTAADDNQPEQMRAYFDRAKQIFGDLGATSRGPWVDQIEAELLQKKQ